jgi:isopenicillin N synthase-like dioxygenase
VATPDGRWVDAPPLAGSFVVNVGTMLHRWSNGRLLATPHRVINTSGAERYSVPFFYDPDVTTVIEPLACCIDANCPARFEPIEFGAFLRHELESGYRHHQPDSSR